MGKLKIGSLALSVFPAIGGFVDMGNLLTYSRTTANGVRARYRIRASSLAAGSDSPASHDATLAQRVSGHATMGPTLRSRGCGDQLSTRRLM